MRDAGGLGRAGQVLCLSDLLVGRKVLPEVRHAVRPVRSGEGPRQAGLVVEIGLYEFGAEFGKGTRLGRARIARDRPGGKPAAGVRGDGAHQAAALGAGRAGDGDDFLVVHVPSWFVLLSWSSGG